MKLSVRSALTAGVAATAASCVVVSGSVTPLPDQRGTVGAAPASAQHLVVSQPLSSLTTSDVMLLASVQTLLAEGTAQTLAPPVPSVTSVPDAIDDLYVAIEEWVRYGFEVAADIVAWIPWVGIFANQIMVVYNFVESLINSGVFNTTDWLRGEGSVLKNVADWVVDLGLAVVWLGIGEVGAWIPLPPLDWYPPRPPAADLPEGSFGDAVVGASHLLADVSNAIWNVWLPIRGGVDWAVSGVSGLLDAVSWIPFVPLIDMEIVEGWNLIAGEIDALTGFAHDMINAGDQFITDTIQGDGLIAAVINATNTTLESIGTRSGEAVQALVDWVNAQIQFFLSPFDPAESTANPAEERTSALAGDSAETVENASLAPEVSSLQPADTSAGGSGGDTAGDAKVRGPGEPVGEVSGGELGTQPDDQNESAGAEPDAETTPPVGEDETPGADAGQEDEGDGAVLENGEETAEGADAADVPSEPAQPDDADDESAAGNDTSEGNDRVTR